MISTADDIELSRLYQLYCQYRCEDDLVLRQTVNDMRILLDKMQTSLGVVAMAGNPLDIV